MIRKLVALLISLMPAAALAEGPACTVPAVLPRPHPEGPSAREPKRLLPIGGYTLALSWSPEYCHAHRRDAQSRIQCGSDNRFGFTLHGLWPDGLGKDWPQYCQPAALLPEAQIRASLCATPSPQLLQHEWAKHGTCTTLDAKSFFATADRLYRGIAAPDMAALSRRPLTVAAFSRAFAAANPGLREDMLRLNVNRRGWLEEVWLCLGKDMAPRRCPATQRGAAPAAVLKIERGDGSASGAPRRPRSSPSRDDGDRDGDG